MTGTSGLYSIELPDGNWQKLPSGTLHKGTDIELRENRTGLNAWVYVVKKDGDSFIERINWRRKDIIDGKDVKSANEKRFLIGDTLLMPVSHGHYEYKKDGAAYSWWIKTIDTGNGLIELLAYSSSAKRAQPVIDQLFKNIQVVDMKKTVPQE